MSPRHHVFVCTTGYDCHWAASIGSHRGMAHPSADEERELAKLQPEHANGHIGDHCGDIGGGELFEQFKAVLADRNLGDVQLAPNACMAQHIAGPVVIVYPDGVWYGRVQPEDVNEIVESHLIGGTPVDRLIWREVNTDQAPGCVPDARVAAAMATRMAAVGTAVGRGG